VSHESNDSPPFVLNENSRLRRYVLRARGEITELFGEGRQSLIVMAGEGPPSKTCSAGPGKGVDGGPSPAMTGSVGTVNVEAPIYPQSLSADRGLKWMASSTPVSGRHGTGAKPLALSGAPNVRYGSRLCKNARPVFVRIFGADGAVGLYSERSQPPPPPSSRSERYFAERPQDLPLRPQISRYLGTGRPLPYARIASISGTTPSTFITRFRL
jgi:hypothetical protein